VGIVVCADPEKCDVWIEDASIASIYIHLAAESMALGSCWIQIRKRMHDREKSAEQFIRELLDIPENFKIESMIAVGYPAEKKSGHQKEDLPYEKIHYDGFGKSS
jgi:nitroreductase